MVVLSFVKRWCNTLTLAEKATPCLFLWVFMDFCAYVRTYGTMPLDPLFSRELNSPGVRMRREESMERQCYNGGRIRFKKFVNRCVYPKLHKSYGKMKVRLKGGRTRVMARNNHAEQATDMNQETGNALMPVTARGEATRRKILDAAEEVFGELGYYEASIAEITRRAGVAQGTYYIYFHSKREIFAELVEDIGKRLRANMRAAIVGVNGRLEIEK